MSFGRKKTKKPVKREDQEDVQEKGRKTQDERKTEVQWEK
jgi:hypothetical protein